MAVTPNVINKIKKVEYSALEPSNKGVLWAEPTGENQYTYRVYDNGQWNVVSSGGGGDIPTNISYFYNDVGYITMEDLPSDLYELPETGIPSTDLSSDVQTSLGKADTALQSYTETDPTVPSWAKAESKPSYTASEVGAVPTTRTVNGKALSSNITLSASDVSALPSSTTIPTITFRQW